MSTGTPEASPAEREKQQSRSAGKQPEPRSGDELLDASARDDGLIPTESEDLLAYYLENQELPGSSDTLDVEVELGHGAHVRKLTCTIRPIDWAEWQDGQDRATRDDRFDTFKACSYHVARALIKPKLGPQVQREQREASESDDGKIAGPGKRIPPAEDAAALLRRMFYRQPGALLDLSAKVIEVSKLGAGSQAVREIEAAKN